MNALRSAAAHTKKRKWRAGVVIFRKLTARGTYRLAWKRNVGHAGRCLICPAARLVDIGPAILLVSVVEARGGVRPTRQLALRRRPHCWGLLRFRTFAVLCCCRQSKVHRRSEVASILPLVRVSGAFVLHCELMRLPVFGAQRPRPIRTGSGRSQVIKRAPCVPDFLPEVRLRRPRSWRRASSGRPSAMRSASWALPFGVHRGSGMPRSTPSLLTLWRTRATPASGPSWSTLSAATSLA